MSNFRQGNSRKTIFLMFSRFNNLYVHTKKNIFLLPIMYKIQFFNNGDSLKPFDKYGSALTISDISQETELLCLILILKSNQFLMCYVFFMSNSRLYYPRFNYPDLNISKLVLQCHINGRNVSFS